MRTQEERDRQSVRIAMVLPLVALALILVVAPLLTVASTVGLLDGVTVGPGSLAVLATAYFLFVGIRIARRGSPG